MKQFDTSTATASQLATVIIPTYNRAHLICDALDSVAAQTYRPIEIIVVDDGSTDQTREEVTRWMEMNQSPDLTFKLLEQANKGKCAARNTGYAKANGEFVAFLDSDDVCLPERIEKQIDVLNRRPEFGAVYCGLIEVDLQDGSRRIQAHEFPQGWLFEQLLVRDVTNPTSTYLFRHSAIETVGALCPEIDGRTDWEMALRLARRYPIGVVREPLVELRAHSGPRTATNRQNEIDGYRYIRRRYQDEIAALPLRRRMVARSSYYRRMGRVQFHGGLSWPKALAYDLAATACDPTDFDNFAALAGLFLPKPLRAALHHRWNRVFGDTGLAIRSH